MGPCLAAGRSEPKKRESVNGVMSGVMGCEQ